MSKHIGDLPESRPPAQPNRSARPVTPSINPDDLSSELDLIHTLNSTDYYSGGAEVISLYSYPSYLTVNLRRVLGRSSNHHDWGAAMSCLIDHGVSHYYGSEVVKRFIAAFTSLDKDDTLNATIIEHLEAWRRQIKFSPTDPTNLLGVQKRHAFKSPESIRKKLSGLAGGLGLSGSVLGTVCVMVGLHDQPGVVPEHASAMRAEIERFERLMEDRERQLSTLLRLAEEGVWP
jgi:hypothetical protein